MKARLKLFPTVLALIFLLSVFSLGAAADVKYDAHDVEKFRAFLEETDADGVTNGSKINALYDPDDPSTWTGEGFSEYKSGVNWNEDGRAAAFYCARDDNESVVYGDFDVSGCDALEYVDIYGAAIESANFDGCTSLSELTMCYPEVPLEQIDLSANTALTRIILSYNALTELDLSGSPNLAYLWVENNKLSRLDLSANPNLTRLVARDNNLTELDLSGSPNLTYLSVEGNKLPRLDLSANPNLTQLVAKDNNLTELDLSGSPNLIQLFVEDNNLTELDISNNMKLITIICERNSIKEIDLTGHSELIELRCNYNELTALNTSECPELIYLQFNYNNIGSIDLSQNLKLISLDCGGNSLTELDVSGLTGLWKIECWENELTSLDLRDTGIQILYCFDNMLEQILFPGNPNVLWLNCKNNRLSSLDVENMPNLYGFDGDGNLFEELLISLNSDDFSCIGNPMRHLSVRHSSGSFELFVEGNGTIGAYYNYELMKYIARAEAGDGETFLGWYDENGNLASETADYALDSADSTLYARFSVSGEPTPTPSAPVIDPTEAPVGPTQAPVDPTQAPVDPTQAPADPDDPTPPTTGAVSLIYIGLAVAAGGASAMLLRRKSGR